MQHIQIGSAVTLTCENWKYIPDDRQETVKTIGSVVVQDFGHIESGDKFSCTCNVSPSNKDTIFNYWENRYKVTIIDEAGISYENMRVKVINYRYINLFEKKRYYNIDFEFWRS